MPIPTSTTQRAQVRLPCELPAEITFIGGNESRVKKVLISNISTTGIQILSPSFVATGQIVEACFKVPGKSSKTTLKAEVMRIESLQGRMIGRFPYALGAKFVEPKQKQEKQIARFISKKISCASWRSPITVLFFILSGVYLSRVILHTLFATSSLAALDNFGISQLGTASSIIHPWASAVVFTGLFSSACLCLFRNKFFNRWGFLWMSSAVLLSVLYLYVQYGLLFGTALEKNVWFGQGLVTALEIGCLILVIQFAKSLHKMNLIISTQKPPGSGRPTFTIL